MVIRSVKGAHHVSYRINRIHNIPNGLGRIKRNEKLTANSRGFNATGKAYLGIFEQSRGQVFRVIIKSGLQKSSTATNGLSPYLERCPAVGPSKANVE